MLLALALVAPNTMQVMRAYRPTVNRFGDATANALQPLRRRMLGMQWRASAAWSLAISVVAAMGTLGLSSVSEFLYFQF